MQIHQMVVAGVGGAGGVDVGVMVVAGVEESGDSDAFRGTITGLLSGNPVKAFWGALTPSRTSSEADHPGSKYGPIDHGKPKIDWEGPDRFDTHSGDA
jgi:hypothetical protein